MIRNHRTLSSRVLRPRRPATSHSDSFSIAASLRKESVGGLLLVGFAALALIWANSPWAASYLSLRDFEIGFESLHLRLSLGAWAADGLLAIFFFLVGLELKRELVAGDLRKFSTALIPVVAAAGGVIVPAGIFMIVVAGSPELSNGWAIPTATDIAFAVAVLALVGSHLPGALRVFLLTLAVVDDLIAIMIIAIFYTEAISVIPLIAALLAIGVYAMIAHRYQQVFRMHPAAAWLVLLPIGVVAWALLHSSGIHATIAGVLLGFAIPVRHKAGDSVTGPGLAEIFEHRFRPLSAGLAVPLFAFFSTGVTIGGIEGFRSALSDPVTIGIVLGLIVGKPLGITLATWAVTRIRQVNLDPKLRWIDITGVAILAGIGFTVSLLVTELSFAAGSEYQDHAKVAVLASSLCAALAASIILGIRNRRYGREELELSSAIPSETETSRGGELVSTGARG